MPEPGEATDTVQKDDGDGIAPDALADGHRYVMGNVNAYCPKCSDEATAEAGRPITVLDCRFDRDK